MLAVVLSGLAGVPTAYLIDRLSARLAGEWYARPRAIGENDRTSAESDQVQLDDEAEQVLGIGWLVREGATVRRVATFIVTVALFGAVAARYGIGWQAAVVCAYMAALVLCSATDIIAHRIADVVTQPAILFAFAVGMIVPAASALDVILGGVVFGGIMLAYTYLPVLFRQSPGGYGDIKLGLFAGLALGVHLVFPALLIMAISGGLGAVSLLLVTRLKALRSFTPYGPYIALGAAIVMLTQGTAFSTP